MRPLEIDTSQDRELVFRERFDAHRREHLRLLITPEVIEEHRRSPWGQHSESLERLLIYIRQRPQDDEYAIRALKPFKAYQIVALSGHRGIPPRPVGEEIYSSVADADHAVFLRYIHELLGS